MYHINHLAICIFIIPLPSLMKTSWTANLLLAFYQFSEQVSCHRPVSLPARAT